MYKLVVVFVLSLLLMPPASYSSKYERKACQLPQDELTLLANVSVRSASNGNIVVIVDQFLPNTADGIPDLVFRFAPKRRTQHQNVSFDLQGAKVFFTTRRLAVISSDGHVMISLSLEEVSNTDPFFAVYGNRSTDLPNTVRISNGIGLQRQVPKRAVDGSFIPIDIEEDFVDRAPVVRTQDDEFEIEQRICTAGGIGSTSCCITCQGGESCCVSCSSGNYSCCYCNRAPSCRCRVS